MFDSLRNRFLLAIGVAGVGTLLLTLFFSGSGRDAEKSGETALAAWKARTGVDLRALPQRHPQRVDSEDARALDALLKPIDLHLGARTRSHDRRRDVELDELRDYLRGAIRSSTAKPRALPAPLVSLVERRAATLDSVAEFVATHGDIQWLQDFAPRPQRSVLFTDDHLTLHRLLIGRGFLALERGDSATVTRMLTTSQQLNRVLSRRAEAQSHFVAVGVERLQLALMRAGSGVGLGLAQPDDEIRARYVTAMSAEAWLALVNADSGGSFSDDAPDRIIHALARPNIQLAASEAVELAAEGVEEIGRAKDGCAELSKKRRKPHGMFAGNFHALDATEAWRRFVVLQLDRALTAAVLTGQSSSPCTSVVIAVRDDGAKRTVELEGLPTESDHVIGVPSVVTSR